MRILQIISSMEHMSGPVRTLQLLSHGLKDKGHQVVAVCYLGGDEGAALRQLRHQGLIVHRLSTGKLWRPLTSMALLARIGQLVRRYDIEAIHAHSFDADMFGACGAWKCGARRIVTIHSRSYFHWMQRRGWKYQWLILPRVDIFVCVCASLAEEFQRLFPQWQHKVRVIYNALPDQYFVAHDGIKRQRVRASLLGKDTSRPLLGVVANANWVKGTGYLLEALTHLPREDYQLVLIGANYGKAFKDQVSRLGLQQRVITVGIQEDIAAWLDAIDIFIHPSVEEADPWVVTEAMARGKPIIATSVGGVPEKVRSGMDGILVVPKDSRALAEAIGNCLRGRVDTRLLGRNAQRSLKRRFPYSAMLAQHEDLYQ